MLRIIEKIYYEMSFHKDIAENKVRHIELPLFEHIILCLLYKSSHKSYNHWKHEIWTFLKDISGLKLKPKGRFIDKEKFYELLIKERWDNLTTEVVINTVNNLMYEYGKVSSDVFDIVIKLDYFYSYVCDKIRIGNTTGEEFEQVMNTLES